MQKGLFVTLFLLSACSSNMETGESPQQQASLMVSEHLVPQAPDAEDVLYANIVLQEGQWRLNSIGSQRQAVDILKGEERLYIQTRKRIAMPDYDHHQYRDEAKKFFDCGQKLTYNKHTTYNPCASQFCSNIKFGEGWFGWTRRLDVIEIKKAVQHTGLLKKAEQEMALVTQERQRCQKLRQQAEALAARQQVALRVVDETGMYKRGHEHVQYDLKIKPEVAKEGCEQELAAVKMHYDLGIEQSFNLVLEMRGKSGWNKLDDDKLILQRSVAEVDKKLVPTLYITGKKVEHYNLYQTWSNADVEINWRTLDITNTDLRQTFDIRNLGASAIKIQRLTFHINGHKVHYLNRLMLPAQKSATGLEHASRYFVLSDKVRQHVEAIRIIDKLDEQAEFGVTLVYKLKGKQKSLKLSDNIQLSKIL